MMDVTLAHLLCLVVGTIALCAMMAIAALEAHTKIKERLRALEQRVDELETDKRRRTLAMPNGARVPRAR